MKIHEVSALAGAVKNKKAKKSGDGGAFDSLLSSTEESEGASGSSSVSAPATLNAMDSLLTLQEVSDGEISDKQAMQQGNAGLDVLDDIRKGMLQGDDNPHELGQMRHQLERIRQAQADDPKLKEIMSDIELRLAVEIAKRETV